MRRALAIYPGSTCPAVAGIDVTIERPDARHLALTYVLTGDLSRIFIPVAASPLRIDGLWRRTCFEAFIRAGSRDAYSEFNFSPSREWAAYGFSGHRAGMAPAEIAAPTIEFEFGADRYELRAHIKLSGEAPWRLGLSAVIEDIAGGRSYWALAHPPGQADFHHPDAFAVEIV